MNISKFLQSGLVLILMSTAISTANANGWRSEYEAYESCSAAIKRELNASWQIEFEQNYGRTVKKNNGMHELFLNLSKLESDTNERSPYKAHCRSRGFGSIQTLLIETGHWNFDIDNNS